MNSITRLLVAGLVLVVSSSIAQTTTAQPARNGKVVVPERPTATDANLNPTATARPTRPERPPLPAVVQTKINRFKLDARAYLAKQEAIKKLMQGANEQERAALRDQLNNLRQQFLEQSRDLRTETKDRAAQLESKLPAHQELLEEIRNSASDQRQQLQQSGGGRPRRGRD